MMRMMSARGACLFAAAVFGGPAAAAVGGRGALRAALAALPGRAHVRPGRAQGIRPD